MYVIGHNNVLDAFIQYGISTACILGVIIVLLIFEYRRR